MSALLPRRDSRAQNQLRNKYWRANVAQTTEVNHRGVVGKGLVPSGPPAASDLQLLIQIIYNPAPPPLPHF